MAKRRRDKGRYIALDFYTDEQGRVRPITARDPSLDVYRGRIGELREKIKDEAFEDIARRHLGGLEETDITIYNRGGDAGYIKLKTTEDLTMGVIPFREITRLIDYFLPEWDVISVEDLEREAEKGLVRVDESRRAYDPEKIRKAMKVFEEYGTKDRVKVHRIRTGELVISDGRNAIMIAPIITGFKPETVEKLSSALESRKT